VRDGEDSNVRRHLHVDDVIRKARDGSASNHQVRWHSADPVTGVRHRHDLINGGVNGIEELDAQMLSPTFVPAAGEAGIQHPPRRQSEREDSLLAEFGFSASPDVVPRHSPGLVCQGPASPPLDFGGPRRLDIGWTLRSRVVKAGQEFGRHVGTFIEGQRQSFAQKILRSRRHIAILHGQAAQHGAARDAARVARAPQPARVSANVGPLNTTSTMTSSTAVPTRRFGLVLWAAGMVGSAAITVMVLPQLLGQMQVPLPAPLWVLTLAGLAQSALLLALAVWAGVRLTPSVGLRAPAFEAVVTGRPFWLALRPQLLPGLIAGVLAGISMFAAFWYAPAAVAQLQNRFAIPIVARVLYGGITEELLLRWGLLTTLAWLAWRFLQQRRGPVRAGFVWLAIAVSALIFAVGHLPAASVLLGAMDVAVVAFVIGVNTAFGLLFGFLFWRHGLESAVIAHALAHAVSFLSGSLWFWDAQVFADLPGEIVIDLGVWWNA
jgi:membrane protease YdiL (CAAX protease family)